MGIDEFDGQNVPLGHGFGDVLPVGQKFRAGHTMLSPGLGQYEPATQMELSKFSDDDEETESNLEIKRSTNAKTCPAHCIPNTLCEHTQHRLLVVSFEKLSQDAADDGVESV